MMAALFKLLTDAHRDKQLTAKEFADAALGLDAFLESHPDTVVSDYTDAVRSKLAKKSSKGKTTTEPAQPTDDAGGLLVGNQAPDKGKAEIAETVKRMAGKAAEQEELIPEEDIF